MTADRKNTILRQALGNIYKCSENEYTEIIKDYYKDKLPSDWNKRCTYCRLQKLKYIARQQNILN